MTAPLMTSTGSSRHASTASRSPCSAKQQHVAPSTTRSLSRKGTAMLDLNHASGFIYGCPPDIPGNMDVTARINAHVDGALVARNQCQQPREYLGGSRV